MRSTVEWLPSALQELAEIWADAADRAAITAASHAIDRLLERDPLGQGEGREGATRILFVEPLVALDEVDGARRQVRVFDLWRYPP
jgi:hypothetical protein